MAEANKRKYPKIARGAWFALRDKLKQRVPAEISSGYVGTSLGMEPSSAASNVLPALRTFGLIDDAGKPTDRAYDWRDDAKYPEVCNAILEEVYPQELRDLFHGPEIDGLALKNWFSREARVGDAAANKFAITYQMLLEADLEKARAALPPKGGNGAKPAKVAKAAKVASPKKSATPAAGRQDTPPPLAHGEGSHPATRSISPKLHIDIQIHISPDSTSDQIDKIFESMSKHLRDFKA